MKNRNVITSNTIFKNFIIPNALLSLYSGIYSVVSSKFYTVNVNLHFSSALFLVSLVTLLIFFLLLIFFIIFKKDRSINKEKPCKFRLRADYWLLLLIIVPVTRYSFENSRILSVFDMFIIMVIITFVSFILIFIVPRGLEKYSSFRILRSISTAYIFTILNMASMSRLFFWLETGNLFIQFGLLFLTFIIIWLIFNLSNKERNIFVFIFFIGSAIISIIPQSSVPKTNSNSDAFQGNKLLNMSLGRQIITTPNIYLLVYDAYISNDVLLKYGIDNTQQEKLLIEFGFTLYPNIYSIGSHTLSTMNKILNVSLDNYGHIRRGVSGDGVVQRILKDNNYETFGIFPSDYMFIGIGPNYDFYVPEKQITPYMILLTGMLYGEFRFDIGLDTISYDQFLETKNEVFSEFHTKNIFVYSHSNYPGHSQNSGKCLVNEIDLFKDRLIMANIEMKEDIKFITENDPNSIIIIAGDHGPYLTKNCDSTQGYYTKAEITKDDIRDRIATFLAIKWPTEKYKDYDEIVVIQDIFPVIFSYLYEDSKILDTKLDPELRDTNSISGVTVIDGIIYGGINDGEFLFDP